MAARHAADTRSGRGETLRIPAGYDGSVWRLEGRAPAPRRAHHHVELEVNLALAGRATYLVDDQRYDLSRGTQIWLFPRQDHVLIDESPDYAMWIGVFRPHLLNRICTDDASAELLRSRPLGLFCKRLTGRSLTTLDSLFSQAVDAQPHTALFNATLAHVAMAAWTEHRRADAAAPYADVHPAVERAARLIRDEQAPLSLDDIADRAGLSPGRLSRLFKQQVGVPLSHYRQRCQLERFIARYGQGQRRNITEAALAAGFGSYPQFYRVFRRYFGIGPADYRRQQRET